MAAAALGSLGSAILSVSGLSIKTKDGPNFILGSSIRWRGSIRLEEVDPSRTFSLIFNAYCLAHTRFKGSTRQDVGDSKLFVA